MVKEYLGCTSRGRGGNWGSNRTAGRDWKGRARREEKRAGLRPQRTANNMQEGLFGILDFEWLRDCGIRLDGGVSRGGD